MIPAKNRDLHTGFITNLPESAELKDLWTLFKKEGRIKDIILPHRRDKNNNRYGFVKVFNEETLERLICSFNGYKLKDKKIFVNWARKREPLTSAMKNPSKTRKREETPIHNANENTESMNTKKKEGIHSDEPVDIPKSYAEVFPIDITPNKNFVQFLNRSIVVETWKDDCFLAIRNTMNLLGFGEVGVKTMSSKRFLVTFPEGTDLETIDLDFVGLGFLEIKKAIADNLIVPRTTCVEIRGLPISAWSEDNFLNNIGNKGKVLEIAHVLLEEHLLSNPRVLLETYEQQVLYWKNLVCLEGKEYTIHCAECPENASKAGCTTFEEDQTQEGRYEGINDVRGASLDATSSSTHSVVSDKEEVFDEPEVDDIVAPITEVNVITVDEDHIRADVGNQDVGENHTQANEANQEDGYLKTEEEEQNSTRITSTKSDVHSIPSQDSKQELKWQMRNAEVESSISTSSSIRLPRFS